MHLSKGNGELPVTARSVVSLRASGEFYVQAHGKDGLISMLGPARSIDRFLRVRVPEGCTKLVVKCKPSINWQCAEAHYNGQERADPIPVEMPIGGGRPDTLAELIQKYVREAVSSQAEAEGKETFEEANDFDVEDPFEIEMEDSRYTEMEEEVPLPLEDPDPAEPDKEEKDPPCTPAPTASGEGDPPPKGDKEEPKPDDAKGVGGT